VSRLGLNTAKRAFLTAQALPIEQLHALGLFECLADSAGFDAALAMLVQTVAGLAPLAMQATKRSLNEIAAGLVDEPAMRAREALTGASADFAEGRAAFAARRPPRFAGR
jgi:enoyl-CoA hydratase/carnithine racemase